MPDPVVYKPASTDWLNPKSKSPGTGSVIATGGVQQNYDPGEFEFTPKYNQNNYRLRAQAQPWYEQGAKMLGNAIFNTATGLIEGFAYIPEIFDKDRDYSNAVTRQMQDWKNLFGEIYRENPEQTFDLSDPAWWFTNIQMLAESAGAFALEGAAIGKLFSAAAKGAGALMKVNRAGQIGRAVVNEAAKLATAATLSYTEGAMSGYRVYDQTYQEQRLKNLRAGMGEEEADAEARKRAGQAAATTVRMNTAMNTVLNLGIIAPMFHGPTDKAVNWWKTTGARAEGKSLPGWKSRVAAAAYENPEIKRALNYRGWSNSIPAEMVKEGVEEVNTQYAEQEGLRVGKGEGQGMFRALANFERYFKDVSNQEGALNFILGAFGGVAQTVLIDAIPRSAIKLGPDGKPLFQKGADGEIVTDANGKPKYQKEFIRPKAFDQRGKKQYFDNIKESILSDINTQEKLQQDLVKYTAEGNVAKADYVRSQLFSITALDAVQKGMTENWQEEFRQIEQLDNTKDLGEAMNDQITQLREAVGKAQTEEEKTAFTQQLNDAMKQQEQLTGKSEAMLKGFATSMKDESYKERARDAVQDLKHLQDLHGLIQKRIVTQDNPISGEAADHLFFRKADIYMRRRGIQREEAALQKEEAVDSYAAMQVEDLVNRSISKYNEHLEVLNSVENELDADITALQKADANATLPAIQQLLEKYKIKDSDNLALAMSDLVNKFMLKRKLYQQSSEAARTEMEESSNYKYWKEANPDKSFKDYVAAVQGNVLTRNRRAYLESFKMQTDVAEQNLTEIESSRGIEELYKALTKDRTKAIDKLESAIKKSNTELDLAENNKKSAASLSVQQKQVVIARLEQQIEGFEKERAALDKKREALETELKTLLNKGKGIFTNFNKIVHLRSDIALVKSQLSSIEAQINTAKKQLSTLGAKLEVAVQNATIIEQQPAEDILDELDPETEEDELPEQTQAQNFDPESKPESDFTAEQVGTSEEDSALDEYMNLKNTMPAAILKTLDGLETEFTAKGYFSFQEVINAMQPHVSRGTIEKSQVYAVAVLMKQAMDSKKTSVVPAAESTEQTSTDTPADVELPVITHSEQPMILVNEAMWTNEGIADQYWTPSAKTTNTVKANSADLKYITIANGNRLMLRNETVYENGVWAPQLDDTSNKDRMVAGRIKAGDAVILRVDKDWDGKINNHHTLEQDEYLRGEKVPDTFAGYTDNGKIRTSESMKHQGYANVPIQIIHEATGKVIGYFPMNDWVNETLGAETYRNVEDYDEEGNPGMVDRQSRINLAIRKRIAEQWNADPTAEVKTTIAYRTTGRVMHAGEVSATGKVKYQVNTAFKMLPDPKLNMGVATKEAFLVGKGAAASNQMTLVQLKPAEREAMAGSPVVYLPMPNGEYLPQPLETKKLSGKSDFTTMSKVIELHLQAGTSHLTAEGEKMIADIQAATTFDISTTQGLKDFIEQYYTYTSNFMDAVTNVDAPADTDAEGKQSKVQQFLIAVPNSSTKLVKIGFTFSGRMPAYAKLQNGKLSDDFNNMLKAGLATRFKNVVFTDGNLRGTNDTRPITSILITEDGQLRRYKHDNYNAYMKTFTYTSVYGHTKIDGNYVYAANSQAVLTPDPLLPQVPSVTSLTTKGAPDTETQMDVSDDESVIDSLSNFALAPGYVEPVIKPEGKPLTLENLTDLYNFTEAGERNGKTPEQVMTHLKSLNISALADGYNPFVKCS